MKKAILLMVLSFAATVGGTSHPIGSLSSSIFEASPTVGLLVLATFFIGLGLLVKTIVKRVVASRD